MVDIFINYRTLDARYGAATCYEFLSTRFGAARVFRDCVSMRPGEVYPQAMREALEQTRVLIVLIGPQWFATDEAGGRLVDRDGDWVRREIRRSLERGIAIVPVLLDGAAPPDPGALPADISGLALRQAAWVDHRTLGADLRRLATRITDLVPALALPDLFEEPATLPSGALPSMLLRAEHAVVPFSRRQEEVARLSDWLWHGPTIAVRLLTGAGGEGKTRLAGHLVGLAVRAGWAAGFLAADPTGARPRGPTRAGPQATWPAPGATADRSGVAASRNGATTGHRDVLARVAGTDTPMLLVVDYAEGRTDQLAALAVALSARPAGHPPVRLLLLARAPGIWQQLLRRHRDDRVALLFADVPTESLAPLAPAATDRRAEFDRAVRAFATALGRPGRGVPAPPDLGTGRYDRALDVHAAALAALLDQAGDHTAPAVRRDPVLRVLDHERRYWRGTAATFALPDPHDSRLEQVVSAATLCGARDVPAARAVLAALPTLDGVGLDVVDRYRRWLTAIYPGPDVLNPVRPDRLGEDLVATTLAGDDGIGPALAGVLRPDQVTRALAVAARAAPRHPHLRAVMVTLLAADPATRLPLGIAVATQVDDGGALAAALAEASERALRADHTLDEVVLDHLPDYSLSLGAFAVVRTRAALDRQLRASRPDPAAVARLTHNLSLRLDAVGHYDEALTTATRAVDLFQALAEVDPEAEIDLASAQNTLAGALGQLGFAEDGLVPAVQAVRRARLLAGRRPGVRYVLATALMTYGTLLGEVARRSEAVAAIEEAVALHRADVSDVSAVSDASGGSGGSGEGTRLDRLARLAACLDNLCAALADLGRHPDALDAAAEAVSVYRDLDAAHPDRFRTDLVRVLGNLSGVHGELGRWEPAHRAAAESVALARELVERHGSVHTFRLADALHNLAVALARLGRYGEAVTLSTEAVARYRDLAGSRPGTHLPGLATALHHLGDTRRETGDPAGARDAYDEAVDILRKLAGPRSALPGAPALADPATGASAVPVPGAAATVLPELAEVLLALAAVRHGEPAVPQPRGSVGRDNRAAVPEDTYELAEEGIEIYTRLVGLGWVELRPRLARSWRLLARVHHDHGRFRDAAAAGEQACAVYAELAHADVRPEWTAALHDWARSLDAAGDGVAALPVYRQAAGLARSLSELDSDTAADVAAADSAAADIADSAGELSAVLHNLAVCLSGLGRHGSAHEAVTEAVALRRAGFAAGRHSGTELAESLNNLADTLVDLGRHGEATGPAAEAVELAAAAHATGGDPGLYVYALVTRAEALAPTDLAAAVATLALAWRVCHDAGDRGAGEQTGGLVAVVRRGLDRLAVGRAEQVRRHWESRTAEPLPPH